MSKDLKTLEDVEGNGNKIGSKPIDVVRDALTLKEQDIKEELWQEVYKWIKQIKKDFELRDEDIPKNLHIGEHGVLEWTISEDFMEKHKLWKDKLRGITAIVYLMYIFNISEEDMDE